MTKNKPIKIGSCRYGWTWENGEWIEHEAEQDVIRVIKELRSEGVSFEAIKKSLEKEGYGRREQKGD